MIKFRSHRSANSAEFKAGAPGEWPREEIAVSPDHRLSPEEVAAGWVLLSDEEWQAIRATHRAAWDAWEANQKAADDSSLVVRRAEIADVVAVLQQTRDSSGTLTAAQLSGAVRALARAELWIIKNAQELFER